MPLTKGRTNNPNGRPKGSKNKTSTDLRQFITNFVERNADEMQTAFNELDAKSKLQVFDKFCAYVIPKPQTIDLTAELTAELSPRFVNPRHMSDEEIEAELKRLRMADSDGDEINVTDPQQRAELEMIKAEIKRLEAVGVEK